MIMATFNRFRRILAAVVLSGLVVGGPCHAAAAAQLDVHGIEALLKKTFPGIDISSIARAPIPGIYEVMLGPEVVYVSADGRYLLQGDLLDLEEKRNRSEDLRAAARTEILKSIPLDEVIEFSPPSPRYTVYAFTDVSCGFCRRLHRDVPTLNKMGIAIRYVAFPRNGPGSQAFRDMESVWCSADRKEAMTAAKSGRPVAQSTCDNPVRKQFELGRSLGIHGTPAIFMSDGRALPGYLPPKEFLEALQKDSD